MHLPRLAQATTPFQRSRKFQWRELHFISIIFVLVYSAVISILALFPHEMVIAGLIASDL